MAVRRTWLWLGVLAGAGALYWWWSRNRSGSTDLIDEVVVTAKKIGSAVADVVSPWLSKVPSALKGIFSAAALQYGLPPNLLEAVAYRESRFRADVISGALRSLAGAVGLMQIIPRFHPDLGEAGALDPSRAIPYAASYLRQLFNRFGDWQLALAAYNWGPDNLKSHVADPSSWPAQTRGYVAEIVSNAGLI